jgi:hypothetical protein
MAMAKKLNRVTIRLDDGLMACLTDRINDSEITASAYIRRLLLDDCPRILQTNAYGRSSNATHDQDLLKGFLSESETRSSPCSIK